MRGHANGANGGGGDIRARTGKKREERKDGERRILEKPARMNVMAVVVVMPIIMGGKKSKWDSEKKRLADVKGKREKTPQGKETPNKIRKVSHETPNKKGKGLIT